MFSILSQGSHTLTAYKSNNVRGLGFDVHFGDVLVSGMHDRIAMTGYPGDSQCVIDRFYIDRTYRRSKDHHGTNAMSLLLSMYGAAGTSVVYVTNPTAEGRLFYIGNGFETDPMGNLIIRLSDSVRKPSPPLVKYV